MDPQSPKPEVSEENARHSLMQISQSEPDRNASSRPSPTTLQGSKNDNGCPAEDYRLKLISISDTQSPTEFMNLPAQIGNITS